MADSASPLWTANELAAYLGVDLVTLAGWRVAGRGPRSMKTHYVGWGPRYRQEDVDAWLDEQSDVYAEDMMRSTNA